MSFRYLRRGPFVATDIPNAFEAVEKYLIYQRGRGVGKTARIVMKNINDINTARKWIKDNGHSFCTYVRWSGYSYRDIKFLYIYKSPFFKKIKKTVFM